MSISITGIDLGKFICVCVHAFDHPHTPNIQVLFLFDLNWHFGKHFITTKKLLSDILRQFHKLISIYHFGIDKIYILDEGRVVIILLSQT